MTTPRKPRWLRPWSDEASWQAQARKTVTALDKETYLTWLDGAGVEAANLSFGGVWGRSEFMGKWLLRDLGLAPSDRAMLVYAPGPEFFVAFVACLRAGVLAVPNYPPDPANVERGLEKLDLVATSCGALVGLTDSVVNKLRMTTSIWKVWPKLRWHNTEGLGNEPNSPSLRLLASARTTQFFRSTSFSHLVSSDDDASSAGEAGRSADSEPALLQVALSSSSSSNDEASESLLDIQNDVACVSPASSSYRCQKQSSSSLDDKAPPNDDAIAFLQFTSGSTGCVVSTTLDHSLVVRRDPKGVMISHCNIWHNVNEIYLPGQHNFLGSRMDEGAVKRLHDLAEPSARVVAVSWLPQFHDSGLMLMLLGPFLAGHHQC